MGGTILIFHKHQKLLHVAFLRQIIPVCFSSLAKIGSPIYHNNCEYDVHCLYARFSKAVFRIGLLFEVDLIFKLNLIYDSFWEDA